MKATRTLLVYPRDMLSSTRIVSVAQQHDVAVFIDVPPEQVEVPPLVTVVEMGSTSEQGWQERLRRARERWPTAPILAFGPHVDVEARQQARRLGATLVLSRNRFHHEWPLLLASYLAAAEDPTGCRGQPSALAQEGFRLFDEGAYYECHELLEEAWRAEQRPCRDLYQGLLQFGIALYHIQRGHYPGAYKMLRRAERHLRDLPATCLGVDVATLRSFIRQVQETLIALGPERLRHFPEELFPKVPYHVAP